MATFTGCRVKTDLDGRFAFPQVPAGQHRLVRLVGEQGPPGMATGTVQSHQPLLAVDIRSGETTTVTIGGAWCAEDVSAGHAGPRALIVQRLDRSAFATNAWVSNLATGERTGDAIRHEAGITSARFSTEGPAPAEQFCALMKGIADTGFLVAFANRNDAHHEWPGRVRAGEPAFEDLAGEGGHRAFLHAVKFRDQQRRGGRVRRAVHNIARFELDPLRRDLDPFEHAGHQPALDVALDDPLEGSDIGRWPRRGQPLLEGQADRRRPGLGQTRLDEQRRRGEELPEGWGWVGAGERLSLLTRTQPADGQVVAGSGPLFGRDSLLVGLRHGDVDHYWVEVNSRGEVTYVGHSRAEGNRLLVGEPYAEPGVTAVADYDLNHDGLVEFRQRVTWRMDNPTPPPTAHTKHVLVPLRGQRILLPTATRRFGTWISKDQTDGGSWAGQPTTLLQYRESGGSFGGSRGSVETAGLLAGTNGYAAVEFQALGGTHYGWLQFNFYQFFHEVSGPSAILQPFLDFLDFGYQPTPDAAVLVGGESSLPLTLTITVTADEVRLDWDPLRYRARLEGSSSLTTPAWETIITGGVPYHRQSLSLTAPTMFYRLRPPTPSPEVVMP